MWRGGRGEGEWKGEGARLWRERGVRRGRLLVWPKKKLLVVVAVGVDVFSFFLRSFRYECTSCNPYAFPTYTIFAPE